MTGFYLYSSNRLDLLLSKLTEILAHTPPPPLVSEVIVVPNLTLRQYLSLGLAERLGVAAHFQYFFSQPWIQFLCRLKDPTLLERWSDSQDLIWALMKILPEYAEHPEFYSLFLPLKRAKATPFQELKLLQLCERIASVFERYALFRPEMVRRWEQSSGTQENEDSWQPILWRHLYQQTPLLHFATIQQQLRVVDFSGLPERVFIFGFSQVARSYFDLFRRLAQKIDLHFFTLNPCSTYWFDIESREDIARFHKQVLQKKTSFTGELHYEEGHPLLASWGKTGRDFLSSLYDLDLTEEWTQTHFPSESTLLGNLQHEIITLTYPESPLLFDCLDTSIRIHSCPNELREVEILYHQLLWMFENLPNLRPWEISVRMPNPSIYASYIRSVFSEHTEENKNIPFTLLDGNDEGLLLQAFFRLLELPSSRLYASEILQLLEFRALTEHFDISDHDIKMFRYWIQESGIRWGQNAKHRATFGLPALAENTLEVGLQRMLLGYATGTFAPDQLFQGLPPACEVHADEFETLGKFIEFTTLLLEWVERLRRKRTLQEWNQELQSLLSAFFSRSRQEKNTRDLTEIRDQLERLDLTQHKFQFDQTIDLSTLRYYLRKHLTLSKSYLSVFSGGVTFSSLNTLRNVPFRVIYLLGMNEGDFPQNSKNVHFDFMLHHPQKGDPHSSQEDKYLFLDALLSAREKFWISYRTQETGNNAILQPSLLIHELLEYVRERANHSCESLIVEHPMESYHPKYFQEADFQGANYGQENFEVCQFLMQQQKPDTSKPLRTTELLKKLGEPEENLRHIKFDDLLHFFYNPTAFFFQKRLSLYFEDRFTPLEDNEPFQLEPLAQAQLKQKIFRYFREMPKPIQADEEFKPLREVMLKRGILPHGTLGTVEFQENTQEMLPFLRFVQELGEPLWKLFFWEAQEKNPSLSRESPSQTPPLFTQPELLKLPKIQKGPFHIFGDLGYECSVYSTGLFLMRITKKKPRHLIYLWLIHLIWNTIRHPQLDMIPRRSCLVCLDENITLNPVENASGHELSTLLEMYWQGLQEPIPFFPVSSFAYRNALEEKKTEEQAWNIVKNVWNENVFARTSGEGENPYLKRYFGEDIFLSPLKEIFIQLSHQFWSPFFSLIESVKVSR